MVGRYVTADACVKHDSPERFFTRAAFGLKFTDGQLVSVHLRALAMLLKLLCLRIPSSFSSLAQTVMAGTKSAQD